jgi:hypothetical protein
MSSIIKGANDGFDGEIAVTDRREKISFKSCEGGNQDKELVALSQVEVVFPD